jgi:hypothetical protein
MNKCPGHGPLRETYYCDGRCQVPIRRVRESAVRPDPTKTGPCELKLSFACTGAGYERLDPRDMLKPETSFRTPIIVCLPCYEMAADIYVKEAHA